MIHVIWCVDVQELVLDHGTIKWRGECQRSEVYSSESANRDRKQRSREHDKIDNDRKVDAMNGEHSGHDPVELSHPITSC